MFENLSVIGGGDVAVIQAGLRVGQDHQIDQLIEAPLARIGPNRTAKVLLRHERRSIHRPEDGEPHTAVCEDGLLGRTAGERHRELVLQLRPAVQVAVLLGEQHREAERRAPGDDRHLVHLSLIHISEPPRPY